MTLSDMLVFIGLLLALPPAVVAVRELRKPNTDAVSNSRALIKDFASGRRNSPIATHREATEAALDAAGSLAPKVTAPDKTATISLLASITIFAYAATIDRDLLWRAYNSNVNNLIVMAFMPLLLTLSLFAYVVGRNSKYAWLFQGAVFAVAGIVVFLVAPKLGYDIRMMAYSLASGYAYIFSLVAAAMQTLTAFLNKEEGIIFLLIISIPIAMYFYFRR